MATKPYDIDEQNLNESAGEDQLQILNETIPATKDFKTKDSPRNDKTGQRPLQDGSL